MTSHIQLGRLGGIRIGLHYSWFLIALLLVLSFAARFHQHYPNWNLVPVFALAVLTTLIFFASLLLHELAHCFMALRYRMQVRQITLFALGGVSQIEGDLPSAASEFRIAIAGPVTSAALGVVFIAVAVFLTGVVPGPLGTMLSWIGLINLSIAAFNMLPGYPMDGGRVLRAFLWWKSGNLNRATRNAANAGTALAITFIVIGIVDFFRGGGLDGLWMAFLGWFLLQASRESYLEGSVKQVLSNIHVSDLMVADPVAVDGRLTLQQFVDHELLRSGKRCFTVRENGAVVGIVTPHDLRKVDRTAWPTTPVNMVMHPLESMRSVEPESSLLDAIRAMVGRDLDQVLVVRAGRFVGLLSRTEVVAYLQTQAELQP